MAAIALAASTTYPTDYTKASIGTTWQEFTIPLWASRVSVIFEAAAGYLAFVQTGIGSPETPADGGAVGTHRWPVAANSSIEIEVNRQARGGPKVIKEAAASSIFLAAQTGTVTASILIEKIQD